MFNENIIAFLIMFLIAKDRYTSEGSIQWMYDFIMNSRLHRNVNVADVLDVFRKYSKEDAAVSPYINNGTKTNIATLIYEILISMLNLAINNSNGFIGNGNIYSKSLEK